jgi:hypothetical protein
MLELILGEKARNVGGDSPLLLLKAKRDTRRDSWDFFL